MKAYRYIDGSGVQIIQNECDEATVAEIYVDPFERGKGIASQLMSETCKDADDEGVTLFVKPWPYGTYDIEEERYYPPGLMYKQLCAFYRKFGFRFLSKETNTMKRIPK